MVSRDFMPLPVDGCNNLLSLFNVNEIMIQLLSTHLLSQSSRFPMLQRHEVLYYLEITLQTLPLQSNMTRIVLERSRVSSEERIGPARVCVFRPNEQDEDVQMTEKESHSQHSPHQWHACRANWGASGSHLAVTVVVSLCAVLDGENKVGGKHPRDELNRRWTT